MKSISVSCWAILLACGCARSDTAPPPTPATAPAPQVVQVEYDFKEASLVTYGGLTAWVARIERSPEGIEVEYHLRAEDGCVFGFWKPAVMSLVTFQDKDGRNIGSHTHLVIIGDTFRTEAGVTRTIRAVPPAGAATLRIWVVTDELTTTPCRIPSANRV